MKILYLHLLITVSLSQNYFINSGFQSPTIGLTARLHYTSIPSWTGSFQMLGPDFWHFQASNFSQYIDLESDFGNGFMSQTVTLPTTGLYNMSFVTRAWTNNWASYVMEIRVNGVLQEIYTANSLLPIIDTVTLQAVAGSNTFLLTEVGTPDGIGTLLDDVILQFIAPAPAANATNFTGPINSTNQTNITNLTQEQNQVIDSITEQVNQNQPENCKTFECWIGWAIILSIPFSQLTGVKYFVLVLEDVWLYYYDNRPYQGAMDEIFYTINLLQRIKWQYLKNYLPIIESLYKMLPLSDYTLFSRQPILSINGNDQTLIRNTFYLLILNFPQNLLLCLLFLLLFRLLSSYSISKWFRRYFFVPVVLIQILLEGNLAYLVFIGFHQLQIMFSFNYVDKAFLVFSLICMFLCVTCMGIFYFMTGAFLEKKACYFIYCFYRANPSYYFLTMKMLYRAFLRGAIHFFLHKYYAIQMILLCCVELSVIIHAICLQKKYGIFLTKTFFCLFNVYHGLMIGLNITLYMEYDILYQQNSVWTTPQKQAILNMQYIIVYCLIANILLLTVIDFLPIQWFRNQKNEDSLDQPRSQSLTNSSLTVFPEQNKKQKLKSQETKIKQQLVIRDYISQKQSEIHSENSENKNKKPLEIQSDIQSEEETPTMMIIQISRKLKKTTKKSEDKIDEEKQGEKRQHREMGPSITEILKSNLPQYCKIKEIKNYGKTFLMRQM